MTRVTDEPTDPAAHPVVSREEWLTARRALLIREKAHTRERDELASARKALPWVRIEKPYRFEGAQGPASLADLFGGRDQLLVYHFMFGPEWEEGCPSCSLIADHVDGALPHLAARGVAFAAVARAPYARLAAFRTRMGWRFPWFSSHGSDFNQDFHVSASPAERSAGTVDYNFQSSPFQVEDLPGMSAFARDASGRVFHTYSAYARGLESPIGTYAWLDLAPRGRDEDGLAFTMAWVRHHDRYGPEYAVDACAGYCAPAGAR